MAAPAGSSTPSQDAIASLITQVSPTGQPARNAPRPARPRQGTKRTASTKAAPQSTQAKSSVAAPLATDSSVNSASTETPIVVVQDESQQAPEQPSQVAQLSAEYATISTNDTKGSLASTSESAMKPSAGADASAATVGTEAPNSGATSGLANPPSSRNAASTSQKPSGTKKRKSFWSSFFSCFSSSHDDDDSNTTMTERNPGTANAMKKNVTLPSTQQSSTKNVTQSGLQAKSGDAFGTSSTSASSAGQAGASTISAANVVMMPVGTPSQPGTPIITAPPSPKTDIAPEIIAANSKEGQVLSLEETEGVLSGAVQAPGSEGLTPTKKSSRRKSSGEASSQMPTSGTAGSDLVSAGDESRVSSAAGEEVVEDSDEEYMDEDERIIAAGGAGIPIDENGNPRPLLAELTPSDRGRKCLVLDLDETLLHSSFKQTHSPDFIVPVEIENQVHNVYVLKRPGVDAFMKRMGEIYEVVVFTASLSKYADPVLDHLDIHQVVKHRLFRESCYNHKGNYVKDLSQLGRPIGETIIIDNSPASYIFHPNNAVPVSSWFNDPHDTELTDLQHFLADLAEVPDVRGVLDAGLFGPNDG